ncbi:MAG: hypothetical protein EOP06_02715 [Proteobacteria bacterium]|nr:MAG: hypothetical protein EOP06_02715 [Pseudomonadota bacterium]
MIFKICFCLVTLCSSSLIAGTLLVTKAATQLTSSASKGSDVVKELSSGVSCEASERVGMFWKAECLGVKGFVSVLKMQREASKESTLASELYEAGKKARINGSDSTRTRSAAMGVRGLNENDELSQVGNLRPDLRAIYIMEDRRLDPKRVDSLERLVSEEIEAVVMAKSLKQK